MSSREVKFRGWEITAPREDGRWVYGSLVERQHSEGVDVSYFLIVEIDGTEHLVEHKSVGQFTGLYDRNGKPIFEGDLVNKAYHNLSVFDCEPTPVEWITGGDSDGWCHGAWEGWGTGEGSSLLDITKHCEVIGTIHDSQEG